MKSFKVDMVVKENGGVFTPLVDKVKGLSPESARDLLDQKYCHNKNKKVSLFDRMGKAIEVAADRFDEIITEDDKNASNNNNENK